MEVEQTLDSKTIDLTNTVNKYKTVMTKYEEMPGRKSMVQAYKKADAINKKHEELTDKIRKENTSAIEQIKYGFETVMGKLHLGETPKKRTIEEYLEPVFERIDNMSQNIYDCTVDSLQEFNKFNAEIKVIMEERDSYQAEAESAYRDYMLIQTEIEKLKDKGISTEIASNQGSNMDLFKLRELITAGKNAVALGNNKLNNYEIRAEEYETAALFSEIMNEIVMAGKQAYDDVTVMVRSFRRSLQPPTKASEMSKYMAQIDGDLRYISKYMFEATKLTSGLSGLLVNLRPNDGVISHETRELIKGKYKTTKSELETLEKSGESMKERMCNLSMKV